MTMNDLPDQFLYSRKGPWPQPSPSHPLVCADEVLNIPPMEELMFNEAIGARYLKARMLYPAYAAEYSAGVSDWKGVTPERLDVIMTETLFTRFRTKMQDSEKAACKKAFENDPNILKELNSGTWVKYDFSAMKLVDPLEDMHVAGTKLFLRTGDDGKERCMIIEVDGVHIHRADRSFGIASVYALQGASYHVLFVVHPALHFPMNSVNAITKTALPMNHPIFQMFLPHSAYSLPLDNAVLENAESVVNNNAQGTRFDPLTGNAYNLKSLFGAGYAGLTKEQGYDPEAYPRYDYLNPQMSGSPRVRGGQSYFNSKYGDWLARYYKKAFVPFCDVVADYIKGNEDMLTYTQLWARYLHTHVHGFPSKEEIVQGDTLAKVMAIYMWNASVSHGGDHWSFANQVSAVEKCLRIRRLPPKTRHDDPVDNTKQQIFSPNDMQRAALCQYIFFQAWAIEPNLIDTKYALPNPTLLKAAKKYNGVLRALNDEMCHQVPGSNDPFGPTAVTNCQPLVPIRNPDFGKAGAPTAGEEWLAPYARTIPQSIQY